MHLSRPVRVLAWVVALAASAGIGAFVAAHTNPLQPDVQAHARIATPSTAASPTGVMTDRWTGTMVSHSEHELHVGGTCVTNWKVEISFAINAKGRVSGRGRAGRTVTTDPCPFASAQPQIERFTLDVGGTRRGDLLVLRILASGQRPPDPATDLGGFSATVLARPLRFSVAEHRVRERVIQSVPDGKTGTYRAVTLAQLACENC